MDFFRVSKFGKFSSRFKPWGCLGHQKTTRLGVKVTPQHRDFVEVGPGELWTQQVKGCGPSMKKSSTQKENGCKYPQYENSEGLKQPWLESLRVQILCLGRLPAKLFEMTFLGRKNRMKLPLTQDGQCELPGRSYQMCTDPKTSQGMGRSTTKQQAWQAPLEKLSEGFNAWRFRPIYMEPSTVYGPAKCLLVSNPISLLRYLYVYVCV